MGSLIVFTIQPGHNDSPTLLREISFSTQPVLEARDQNGTRDLHTSGQVVLSVHSGEASLTGQNVQNWAAGLANFALNSLALRAQSDGEDVVLKAEFFGLPAAFSETLNVDIRATRLAFVEPPQVIGLYNRELTSGILEIEARHQDGQRDTEFFNLVTLVAVLPDTEIPAPGQLVATPDLVLAPIAGTVSYNSVTYPQTGRFQLLATSPGLEPARSPTIELTGALTLSAPAKQIQDQLTFQRDALPEQIPFVAF